MIQNYTQILLRTLNDPGDHEAWDTSFAIAKDRIVRSVTWRSAFVAVAQSFKRIADRPGDKRQPGSGPHELVDPIVARRGDLCRFVGTVFEKNEREQPDYALAAARAAAEIEGVNLLSDAMQAIPSAWPESHMQASVWATVVLIAGLLENKLPLWLIGDQWWDPKYPTSGALWENCFGDARLVLQKEKAWFEVFRLVAEAFRKGELKDVEVCYPTGDVTSNMDKRLAVWDLMHATKFRCSCDEWPLYAKEALKAVTSEMEENPGETWDTMNPDWKDKPRWLVAFKVVILFVTGPLEHELPLCIADGNRSTTASGG